MAGRRTSWGTAACCACCAAPTCAALGVEQLHNAGRRRARTTNPTAARRRAPVDGGFGVQFVDHFDNQPVADIAADGGTWHLCVPLQARRGARGDGVARAALLKSLSEPQQGTTRACPGVQASGKGCKLAGCSTQVGMYCGSPPLIAIIWRWKPSGAASFQCRVRSYRRMRRLGAAADGGVRSSTAVAQPFRCPMCARPAQGAAIAHSSAGAHAPATRTAHCADIHRDALELRDRRDRAHRCTWRCCRSMPCCRGC